MVSAVSKRTILLGPVTASASKKIPSLCLHPYHQHARGCPNFNRRKDCPPRADFFLDQFQPQIFLAIVIFNFSAYLRQRKKIHPAWSERALKNSRHWQGHLRAVLKKFVKEKTPPGYTALFNAEAMGVNLTQTCRRAGLRLEWPPRKRVCLVAVLAKKL
jgi:predicted metal-binding protein